MNQIECKSKTFTNANILKATVGTNCPQGGDSGHGGKTVLSLENIASTDMRVYYKDRHGKEVDILEVDSVSLIFSGDAECDTLIQSLEFAVKILKAQRSINEEGATK
jgi:hypothetical protein